METDLYLTERGWRFSTLMLLTLSKYAGLVAPPFLARGRQGVNGVVILVEALQRFRIVSFNAGSVILRPVGDAFFAVVVLELMNPALANKRHVANHSRRGEARQVSHDL